MIRFEVVSSPCSVISLKHFYLNLVLKWSFDFPFEGNIWCPVPRWPVRKHIRSVGRDTASSKEEESSDLRRRATAARSPRQRRNHAQTHCWTACSVCSCNSNSNSNRWCSCKELIGFSELFWEAFFSYKSSALVYNASSEYKRNYICFEPCFSSFIDWVKLWKKRVKGFILWCLFSKMVEFF